MPEATTTTVEPVELREFVTRPDLTPPVIEVLKAESPTPGLIFLAPKQAEAQTGTIIVDDEGELVWSNPQPERDSAADFRVQTYQGEPVLTWWEGRSYRGWGEGEFVIADTSYREIARIEAGNGRRGDLHELQLTEEGTALVVVYEARPADLRDVGGPEDGYEFANFVQEIDVETGELIFEWDASEYVEMTDTYDELEDPEDGTEEAPFDWFHVNSAALDDEGNVLISARNTHGIYSIDRSTGELLWTLGGKSSDFTMGEGSEFAWQHDARQQPDGTISLFDNQSNSDDEPDARALVLRLDEDEMTATLARELRHPDKVRSRTQGNTMILPTGGMVIGWGSAGRVSEFAPDGTLVYDATWAPADSYRVFRMEWRGTPTAPPDVVVEPGDDGRLDVYVSWNGATEVVQWRVLGGTGLQDLAPLATVDKDGFETLISVDPVDQIVVEALDASGQVLGASEPVSAG